MNCIIVDDEAPARKELEYFISNFSQIIIEKDFENAIEALNYLKDNRVDVVFLDIDMPKINGIEMAKAIKKFYTDVKIIFVTAYKEYAYDAFELHADEYLLKPIETHKIIDLFSRLEKTKKNEKISLWEGEHIVVLSVEDVIYIEAKERSSIVRTAEKKYLVNDGFNHIIEILPEYFFKCHRSYGINLNKIKEVEPWFNNTLIAKFDYIEETVPISRKNTKKFKELLGLK